MRTPLPPTGYLTLTPSGDVLGIDDDARALLAATRRDATEIHTGAVTFLRPGHADPFSLRDLARTVAASGQRRRQLALSPSPDARLHRLVLDARPLATSPDTADEVPHDGPVLVVLRHPAQSFDARSLLGSRGAAPARTSTTPRESEAKSSVDERPPAPEWAAFLDALPDQAAVLDADGIIRAVNESWRRFAVDNGASSEAAVGVGASYLNACRIPPGAGAVHARTAERGLQAVLDGRQDAFEFEYPCHSPTEERWFRMRAVPFRDGAIVIHQNVTADRANQQRLRMLELAVEHAGDPIIITKAAIDEPGPCIVYVNEAFTTLTGYEPEDVLGKTPRILQGDDTPREPLDRIRDALERWEPVCETVLNYTKDGTPFWNEIFIAPVADASGWYTHWVSVQRDVTEQHEQRRELIEAKEEAESASRLKSAMLANMSHEIRTPLTSIIGFSEILGDELDGTYAGFAHRVHRSSRRLMHTLDSVLQLSKLEAGLTELSYTPTNLGDEIAETVDMLRPAAADAGVDVHLSLPEPPLTGLYDAGAVSRIAMNLVGNAIKFTNEGGRVDVRLCRDDDAVRLDVEDTGIGISDSFREDLFRAFMQESEGVRRGYEGSGLGLAIVDRLVRLLGGRVDVESTRGVGSRFTVTLPYRSEETPTPRPSEAPIPQADAL